MIRKTNVADRLRYVVSCEISSPRDEEPLPTKVRNNATHVRNAANPRKRFEKGATMMAAIAPIQTRTVRL